MSEVAYRVRIHRRAVAELDALAVDHDVSALKERIRDAASLRQPKQHPTVDNVEDHPDLLKVRGDGIRAICDLAKPDFRVLLVDKRRVVYDRLDTAIRRGGYRGGEHSDAQ